MDNLLDLIIPLIFILTFALNGFLKSKKGQEKEGPSPQPTAAGEDDPLGDLREEIRRRVQESQKPAQPMREIVAPVQRTVVPTQSRSQATENREVAERMQKMALMQKQVKAMQRKADAEKKKAASFTAGKLKNVSKRGFNASRSRSRRGNLVNEVIRELKCPASSRKAVLNTEILGTPIGLRKPSQSQALWGN